MPIIRSAKKKMRADQRKHKTNLQIKKRYKEALKEAAGKKKGSLSKAYSEIDKAAKKGIIEKNKAARLKSNLAKNSLKSS